MLSDSSAERLVTGIAVLVTVVVLTGCIGSDGTVRDRNHATTNAELTTDGELVVSINNPHNATKVEVSTVDGYPVEDPRDEALVATYSGESLTAGVTTSPIAFDGNTTVVVRSYVANGDILTTNVYRLHEDGRHVADLYGNNGGVYSPWRIAATVMIDPIATNESETTYQVTWTHASLQADSASRLYPGHTTAKYLIISVDDGTNRGSRYQGPKLTEIGDSQTFVINQSERTPDDRIDILKYGHKNNPVGDSVEIPPRSETCTPENETVNTRETKFGASKCPLGE